MASEMLRMAGRGEDGTAKPIKTDNAGNLGIINKTEQMELMRLQGVRTKQTENSLEEQRQNARMSYLKSQELIGNGDSLAAWTKYGTSGQMTQSTQTKESGIGAVKLLSSNNEFIGAASVKQRDLSANDIHFRLWAYSPDITKVDRFRMTFYCPDSNNTYSDMSDRRISKSMEKRPGIPLEINQSKANMQAFGNPDWSNCTAIVLDFASKPGQVAEMFFDNVYIQKTNVTKGKVLLRFDDGFTTHHSVAYKKMNTAGLAGTSVTFPTTHINNSPGKMSMEQLKELHTYGWDVSPHTWNHANYSTRNRSQSYNELKAAQNWFIEHGFLRGSRINVFGGHALNEESLGASRHIYQIDGSGIHGHDTLPWSDKHLIRWLSGDKQPATTLKSYVDQCAANKTLTVITFHDLVAGGADYTTDPTVFNNFIDDLSARSDVDVITYSDLLDQTWLARV